MSKPLVPLPEGGDIDTFARERFGEDARVPRSAFHMKECDVLGYIDTPDGCYAVVDLSSVDSQKGGGA